MFNFLTRSRNRIIATFVIVVAVTVVTVALIISKQNKAEEESHKKSIIRFPRLKKQRRAS